MWRLQLRVAVAFGLVSVSINLVLSQKRHVMQIGDLSMVLTVLPKLSTLTRLIVLRVGLIRLRWLTVTIKVVAVRYESWNIK